MRLELEDIAEYGWKYVEDRKQSENVLFLSFIDILKEDEKDDD